MAMDLFLHQKRLNGKKGEKRGGLQVLHPIAQTANRRQFQQTEPGGERGKRREGPSPCPPACRSEKEGEPTKARIRRREKGGRKKRGKSGHGSRIVSFFMPPFEEVYRQRAGRTNRGGGGKRMRNPLGLDQLFRSCKNGCEAHPAPSPEGVEGKERGGTIDIAGLLKISMNEQLTKGKEKEEKERRKRLRQP